MKKASKFTNSFTKLTLSNCNRSNVLFLKNFSLGDFDLVKRSQPFLLSLADMVKEESIGDKKKMNLGEGFRASLPWGEKKLVGMNKYLTQILGYDEYLAAGDPKADFSKCDDFFVWGQDRRRYKNGNLDLAEQYDKRLIRLEYGFISSEDIALKDSPQMSLIICPETMYYDASRPSDMERLLNDKDFTLSSQQIERATRNIASIVKYGVTKYNHAPYFDLNARIKLKKNKKKLLLVDQRYGDKSIEMGLASQRNFEDMVEKALKEKDCQVLLKLHPDALTGGKESALSKALPKKLPENFTIVDFDINPYSLLKECDEVYVCVSQFGFEALMAGKVVHTFGVSFYSHWGLTFDHVEFTRRTVKRSIEEIFYVFYIIYSSYFRPDRGICEVEDVIDYFAKKSKLESFDLIQQREAQTKPMDNRGSVSILFVLPSGRFSATGRYIQEVAWHLNRLGARVMVLAEGNEDKEYSGIDWLALKFEGILLSSKIREKVKDFDPDFIYENGVRTRAQRAALELVVATGARLALQSEDDDIQVFIERHPSPNIECLASLDKKEPNFDDLRDFFRLNDWQYTLQVLSDPNYDRWVEPVLRSLCYHLSCFNTAIWHPFAERLEKQFAKPTFVLPPVTEGKKYSSLYLSKKSKSELYSKYSLSESAITLFLGGTIYDYSKEYFIFLDTLNHLTSSGIELQLVTVSGRSNIDVPNVSKKILNSSVRYVDLGAPDDKEYTDFLIACDIVCSPGIHDSFNKYRLPSRLVKAMFMRKAVLTVNYGFGESLHHGVNGILTTGDDARNWAKSIQPYLDRKKLEKIGIEAEKFAKQHFEVKNVVAELLKKFNSLKSKDLKGSEEKQSEQ